MAVLHLNARYWKPIQSGLSDGTDMETVKSITEFDNTHFYDSTYNLKEPLSPHESAKREGVKIELEKFYVPSCDSPLIIEGAGGTSKSKKY